MSDYADNLTNLQTVIDKCHPTGQAFEIAALSKAIVFIESLQAQVAALGKDLSKFQKSTFNPDWSLLEATQESLREHMALGKELQEQVAALERYECSWTDCGWKKKGKELQEQVAALKAALTEVIEAQHSNFIHNCSDDTQKTYAALKKEEIGPQNSG